MGYPLAVGSRIANYRIEEQIGAGGMGAVYLARDELLGRQVALKVLGAEHARDRESQLRFIRESKAAASVDHPNIIPIFEAGQYNGQLYIVMRYVRGGDVRAQLNKSRTLSASRTAAIVTAIASALDAAHASGLVHRDVKPANMLLDSATDPDSHVYLSDFGITTFTSDGVTTNPGHFVGTPNYAAPETIRGEPADGRTDQFGLACSAFEMLSGAPPFAASDDSGQVGLLFRIVSAPAPALTHSRPDLPAVVDRVFNRALAKEPAERFTSCRQFAVALSEALTGSSEGEATGAPSARRLDVPLKKTFRYVHEPSPGDEVFTSLGNDHLAAELESRIEHSLGGTFLITGFRGVGKSTLVMRATERQAKGTSSASRSLCVTLSVARSTTTEQLLFAIVRRVFEALQDSGELDQLPPETRHALLVAYMRTSLAFKETHNDSRERSAGLNVGIGSGKLVKAVADIAVPSVSMSANRSQSLATEAAFLAYSETDVEYDLMRIVRLVDKAQSGRRSSRAWLRRFGLLQFRRRSAPPRRLHLIVVLDEVDKLTVDEDGLATVEKLMSGIKNILTMPGAHFLVVAGPDLHDRAVRDVARGNGVYESVFGWRLYVPCIWDAPDRLIADIVAAPDRVADGLDALVQYLSFKARGVPRRLLQEINDFVTWDGDHPWLRVGPKDMRRVQFYARMERILRGFTAGGGNTSLFPVAIDEDRWRLGNYYVVDWVLQSEGEPFTAAELLKGGEDAKFDPLLRLSQRSIDRLLDHLAQHGILVVARDVSASNTFISDVAESQEKVYRLVDQVRDQVSGFAVQRESERAAGDLSLTIAREPSGVSWLWSPTSPPDPGLPVPPVAADTAAPLAAATPAMPAAFPAVETTGVLLANRYSVGELIGQGSLSSIYKGRDSRTGRLVVVKMLRPALVSEEVALARFRREGEILRRLNHPNVVRTYDVLAGPDVYAIVMERLQGPTLEERVAKDGQLAPGEAAAMVQILAGAVAYLSGENVARLDLKPANIIMADRGPVIIDLGIAISTDRAEHSMLTGPGQIIGTPAFMAPEVVQGYPAGPAADIYGLGLLLYYALTGKTPWGSGEVFKIFYRILNERIDVSELIISPELRAVLATATARDPEDRFPSAASLQDALLRTPEWRSISSGITETISEPVAPRSADKAAPADRPLPADPQPTPSRPGSPGELRGAGDNLRRTG